MSAVRKKVELVNYDPKRDGYDCDMEADAAQSELRRLRDGLPKLSSPDYVVVKREDAEKALDERTEAAGWRLSAWDHDCSTIACAPCEEKLKKAKACEKEARRLLGLSDSEGT